MTLILQVEGITKRFGGLQALSNVTFDLPKGQILGLIGPKRAGKTTLFNCISGVYAPEEGIVRFQSEDVTGSKTYEMAHRGLARTHQIVQPLNELSVRENVVAGACFGRENHSLNDASEIADEVLEFVGLGQHADQLAANLNVAQKKYLKLARSLAARPYLLLLDSVLAGLNSDEASGMVEIIKKIRGRGITIVMSEQVVKAVMKVSDRMIVLHYGQQIAEGTPEEIANNPQVIEAYLGNPSLAKKLMGERE